MKLCSFEYKLWIFYGLFKLKVKQISSSILIDDNSAAFNNALVDHFSKTRKIPECNSRSFKCYEKVKELLQASANDTAIIEEALKNTPAYKVRRKNGFGVLCMNKIKYILSKRTEEFLVSNLVVAKTLQDCN